MKELDRLEAILADIDEVAIAVSGGIDSLTLATAAHRVLGGRASMHHATSPAVPPLATERTRVLARLRGWDLDVFDAGEFDDPRYRANPVDRCFFCKTNLYDAVARRTTRAIASGTNLDDLGDYRPGLVAARNHRVRHPFVEAGIDKKTVRAIAARLGLGTLAELPSAPCLSSRIETGLRIEARVLAMVDAAEILVRDALSPQTVRCRVRADAVVIELDSRTLETLGGERARDLTSTIGAMATEAGVMKPVRLAAYKTGSAFLRETNVGAMA
jgi:uncharacterized protein